jgi:hypothetical protein
MTPWKKPWRYGGPWYGNDTQRVRFERGTKRHFPSLTGMTRTSGPKSGRSYKVIIDVPYYETRRVEIFFPKRTPSLPTSTADGPTHSPHRYAAGELCIWYPNDPENHRWMIEDGLLVLLGLIGLHLFREAWWRETGEWPGPEAGHPPGDVSPARAGAR